MWRRCHTTQGKPKRVCVKSASGQGYPLSPVLFSFVWVLGAKLCFCGRSKWAQPCAVSWHQQLFIAWVKCMMYGTAETSLLDLLACFAAFSHMTDFFNFNLKGRTWHWSLSFLYHQGNHLQSGAKRSHWNWLISQSGSCFIRATETELGLKLVSESSLLLSEMTM